MTDLTPEDIAHMRAAIAHPLENRPWRDWLEMALDSLAESERNWMYAEERADRAVWDWAFVATRLAELEAGITIPRPQIHTGPKHMTVDQATARYLRDAADRVRGGRFWGSGVTALVAEVLDNVGRALTETDPPKEEVSSDG